MPLRTRLFLSFNSPNKEGLVWAGWVGVPVQSPLAPFPNRWWLCGSCLNLKATGCLESWASPAAPIWLPVGRKAALEAPEELLALGVCPQQPQEEALCLDVLEQDMTTGTVPLLSSHRDRYLCLCRKANAAGHWLRVT